ncbi:MAG: hypothetical protein RIQ56_956 [Candidatus Parcubacteria bacterium]|jgi:hypothetical protein
MEAEGSLTIEGERAAFNGAVDNLVREAFESKTSTEIGEIITGLQNAYDALVDRNLLSKRLSGITAELVRASLEHVAQHPELITESSPSATKTAISAAYATVGPVVVGRRNKMTGGYRDFF